MACAREEPWEDAGAVLGGLFLNAVAEAIPQQSAARRDSLGARSRVNGWGGGCVLTAHERNLSRF